MLRRANRLQECIHELANPLATSLYTCEDPNTVTVNRKQVYILATDVPHGHRHCPLVHLAGIFECTFLPYHISISCQVATYSRQLQVVQTIMWCSYVLIVSCIQSCLHSLQCYQKEAHLQLKSWQPLALISTKDIKASQFSYYHTWRLDALHNTWRHILY